MCPRKNGKGSLKCTHAQCRVNTKWAPRIVLNHPLELSVQRQPKTVFVKCIENNLYATQSTF